MEKKKIGKMASVRFLKKNLEKLSAELGVYVRYAYNEESQTHTVELDVAGKLTIQWIRLMYEFEDLFASETLLFILKNDPPVLKVKETLFEFGKKDLSEEYVIMKARETYRVRWDNISVPVLGKTTHQTKRNVEIATNESGTRYAYRNFVQCLESNKNSWLLV